MTNISKTDSKTDDASKEHLDELVHEATAALADNNQYEIIDQILELSIEDKAELINRLPDAQREKLIQSIQPSFEHDILPHLDADAADDVLHALGTKQSAKVIAELDVEDAVQVISELDKADQKDILVNLDSETRINVAEGLAYPEDSAGRLMRKNMVSVPEFWTIGDAIDHLREQADLPDDFYVIFVVDPNFRPIGVVLLAKIMKYKRDVKISDIMTANIHCQNVATDQEEVAFDFRKYALVEAPVTNEDGKLLGSITIDDIVDVMQEEIEEDFLRSGGVGEQDIQDNIIDTVKKRFPWLFINLITAIAASFVIDAYQETIEKLVILAILMPIIASMGGNAGIQSSTIVVRAIATRRIPTGRAMSLIRKEIILGAFNGLGLAIITCIGIYILYNDIEISLIFAAATIITMMIAGLTGVGLPLLLKRFGIDPAISSGVLLTMVTDMVGFFTFLGLASLII